MLTSNIIHEALKSASLVRKMFETGVELKQKFGIESVFDYSLGNPDLPPPQSFSDNLQKIIRDNRRGIHSYMPNGGWPEVRKTVAEYLTKTYREEIFQKFLSDHVIMTVGAAGALNCVLKTLLDPGDEVIVLSPFFMEYQFYVSNHSGILKIAETDKDFRPDILNIEKAITSKTRVVLINSPNNPTGTVYTAKELNNLGEILSKASKKLNKPIFLIADEPYRKIAFKGIKVPAVFAAYEYTIAVTSFSKDLSIPGERLGYIAVSPRIEEISELSLGLVLANRILGSVNAPSLFQLASMNLLEEMVDIKEYEKRSELLTMALKETGYSLIPPAGTFYLFPESPIPDDLEFTNILQEELILAVPGRGFNRKGYFRLSLCLDIEMIQKSIPLFAKARKKALKI
ncbi:MAG: pyridoxal phosphate-dependent aminotransferase [Clostridiales Family XIII bacterium]|jgi:aspartate aminotransferase|nr:pyridoxal phosphate-dependent aminotransferase [Clostridiales Family XIII bacterium]